MTMKTESEKYNKVLEILRKSKPVLDTTEGIEREVIKRITASSKQSFNVSDLIDFLFGWAYIGWVRRSLIAASVVIVMVFVWQQGIILKRIDFLSRQTMIIDGGSMSTPSDIIEKKLIMYKLTDKKINSRKISISEKQMNQLLESVIELESKYKDLKNLIEEDPELRMYIEKKLKEKNSTKINL
jgi:hypothetical protein